LPLVSRLTKRKVDMELARTKVWRLSRGLSQKELAAEAEVGEVTVARIEGGASVAPSTARKVAGALGVSVADLMESPPVPLGEAPTSPVDHLRGKEDAIPAAAARIDAAKEAAGPQRPPVAQIIERLGEPTRVVWYIPEDERDEWREDLDARYPGGYVEEDGPVKIEVDRTTKVEALA
jgi:transcriptional regulator with XRE-family HTH domain